MISLKRQYQGLVVSICSSSRVNVYLSCVLWESSDVGLSGSREDLISMADLEGAR